jgi:hypothetical protein
MRWTVFWWLGGDQRKCLKTGTVIRAFIDIYRLGRRAASLYLRNFGASSLFFFFILRVRGLCHIYYMFLDLMI